jgi:uncharacterized membrane protein
MRDFFLSSPWPGTIAWALIYISDFVLTVTCARLYRRNVAQKIVFEGSFELNPFFQRDIDSMKFVSPRFLLALVLSSTLIAIEWALLIPDSPGFYIFLLGAIMCMELAIHVRHLGNLYLFRAGITEQLRGQIEYGRPLILRMSSVQFLGFAILFAVVFAFTGNWFVAGGMVSCLGVSAKHWYLARRAARKRAAMSEQVVAR